MQPQLFSWLQETLNRLFIKSPKYFKYWSWISMSLMAISGIPYLLVQFNLHLSEPFATLSNKAVTGASVAMLIMSKLAVKSPAVGQTEQGSEIHVADPVKMPFTSNAEKEKVDSGKPPLDVLPGVPETKTDLSSMTPSAPKDETLNRN